MSLLSKDGTGKAERMRISFNVVVLERGWVKRL
jgi:hypothetical protein